MILGVDFAAMDGNKPVDWKPQRSSSLKKFQAGSISVI